MGLKELFTIIMLYFRRYSQYSNIPTFHGSAINQELFKDH